MPNLDNSRLHVPRYKIRSEGNEYIVRFENQDEYYVVNETGKVILEFLQGNQGAFSSLVAYLESEFFDFSQDSFEEIRKFVDSLVGLSIITTG